VPNDPGATSWEPAEYRRALAHIEQAGVAQARRLARARTMVRVDQAGKPGIRVPAWDDIVHVGPRTIVTPEDRAIQRDFQRRGIPSPLAPDVQLELARRQELARHIQNSPVPEYQQGVQAAMSAVDNVQDAAVTASVAARVSIPLLGQLGTWLAPAVLALGQIATLLNWVAGGLYAFGIAYALACQGVGAAFTQASVPAFAGFLFKGVAGRVHSQPELDRGCFILAARAAAAAGAFPMNGNRSAKLRTRRCSGAGAGGMTGLPCRWNVKARGHHRSKNIRIYPRWRNP